jgi:hypothetical protein
MIIKDVVSSKTESLVTDDPYGKALHIMHNISHIGKVIERQNELWTDGVRHSSIVEFDLVETMDSFSRVIVNVTMRGTKETKDLDVKKTVQAITNIKEHGFFSSAFAEYYMKRMYPKITRMSKNKIKKMETHLSKLIE